jgi:hypothetical protein
LEKGAASRLLARCTRRQFGFQLDYAAQELDLAALPLERSQQVVDDVSGTHGGSVCGNEVPKP